MLKKFSFKAFRKKYGRFILIGWLVFSVGLIINFPVARIAPMLLNIIEKNTGYQITANDISIVLPLGLAMKDVHVQGPPVMDIPVDEDLAFLNIYPSIKSLLTYLTKKSLGLSFKAQRQNEKWSGSAAYGPKYTDITLRAKNLSFKDTIALDQFNAMLAGQVLEVDTVFDIDIDLDAPTPDIQKHNWTKAKGALNVLSKNTQLNNAMLGDLMFDDSLIKANLNKGSLTLDDIHFHSYQLKLDIDGSLKINKNPSASKLERADISLFIDPELAQLVSMVEMVGNLNQLSFKDSVMKFRVSGPINNVSKWRVTDL